MPYLTDASEIKLKISQLATTKILWIDTEVADWYTSYPRLSLIQVLSDYTDSPSESAYVLDVLDKPDLVEYFINQIMTNHQIEKVFHNASFDLRYLGKQLAKNVTCTLKIAKKISLEVLQVSNLKLKTLASELCHFSNVDVEEGTSDWGKRPLNNKQLKYAAMDTVYLAAVHRRLLEISNPHAVENIIDMVKNTSKESSDKSENASLIVTKVRVAFECPRLFYLNHKFNDRAIFLPKNTVLGVGNVFHQLADEFIQLVVTDPQFKVLFQQDAAQLNVDKIAATIRDIFYQIKFFPYLQKAVNQNPHQAQALYQVWQGLQGIIQHFTEILVINRRYCRAETVINNTFIGNSFASEDRKVKHYFQLPNGTQQRVAGEFDCLVYNFELKRLCVIEFKTYQSVDPSAQLAQVSLYSYMLHQQKKVAVDSAVYCVLPEFKEYRYSWEQLENTVHQLIPYKLLQMQEWLSWESPNPNPPPPTTQSHLCEICPQQHKCQSFFAEAKVDTSSSAGKVEEEESITEPPESPNADILGKELVATLQSFKLKVDYQGCIVGTAFIRVKLKPHSGVSVNSILRLSNDLRVQLGLANTPIIQPQAGYVSVDLPRPDRQIARFEEYIQPQFLPATAPVKIAIGVNLEGELLEAELSDSNNCHFLVGGTPGSGKSEFLRSLLLSLLYRHSPQNLKIVLVDPKRVTFPEFEQMSWLYAPVIKDSDRAIELMQELVAEMEFRYQQFEKARCPDLSSYNQRSAKPLPRIVCIFDEYADFMAEKETRSALELSIKRLGAMARAAGIHLIIATQRPEAGVVTPIIKANLPGRVALKTASEGDSVIVLGGKQTSASQLLGKGDLLYPIGSQLHRLQSLFVQKVNLPSV